MRLNSKIFHDFTAPAPTRRLVLILAVACGLLAPASVRAQDDDPYGLPGTSTPVDTPDAPAPASTEETGGETPSAASPADTAVPGETAPATPGAPAAADTAITTDTAAVSPVAPPTPAPRTRITRETTINALDQNRGAFRNPKKALFMSLLVPGLGQAYVGQSPFTYARAAFYLGTEVTLGVMWYQYTVVKYDRKTKQYRRLANEHWSQGDYEQRAFDESAAEAFPFLNPRRTDYCDAVQERETAQGANLYRGCMDLVDSSGETTNYQAFKSRYVDPSTVEATAAFREAFASPIEFYALIGDYQEFLAGWDDAVNVSYSADSISGTSARRAEYNRMRKQAQDYSRMQAWFIGGIVINHIASAVDAALTARHNNRLLYEGEARWYDRVHVDGGLAFDGGRPRTHMSAQLSF